MKTRRSERVAELIREEISDLIRREIRDPRLGGIISITEVEPSPDLRYAKVHVSIMGTEEEKQQAIQALTSAAKFLRKGLGERLTLRYIPELTFHRDDSIERGSHLLQLINEVSAEHTSESK